MTHVDWEQQWTAFAENFYDGKAHIDLSRFGGDSNPLLLSPGPGFGDLSHPTTYLMLQLMHRRIHQRFVIDIGCGSGILTLAALRLGAKSAIGIDIDIPAIEHARQNAKLNKLKALFSSKLPKSYPKKPLFLMNMIVSEQKQVMRQKVLLNRFHTEWITSGILATQRSEYLETTKKWGWVLVEELQRGEWLGMVFDVL